MTKLARALTALLVSLAAIPADAQPVADFYRGKQIRVIVGSAPGDYDTWARVIARHMRNHVTGNPNFVVENRPGAGNRIHHCRSRPRTDCDRWRYRPTR